RQGVPAPESRDRRGTGAPDPGASARLPGQPDHRGRSLRSTGSGPRYTGIVFDIGGPEFLVIAIVALVVLGPERLPEVMRRAGVFYRQARQMLNEYTSQAQSMLEEGMREINDVSNTVSGTFQEATTETAANT